MTIDRTRAKTAKKTEVIERIWDRTNQEYKDLLIVVFNLENPQGWRISAFNVEKRNTSQDRGVQPRMPSAKTAIKLDICTKYARARKEAPRDPTLFRAPKRMMTPTLMKMESDNQIHHQG